MMTPHLSSINWIKALYHRATKYFWLLISNLRLAQIVMIIAVLAMQLAVQVLESSVIRQQFFKIVDIDSPI